MQGRFIALMTFAALSTACTKAADAPADTGMAAQGVITPPADRTAEVAAIKEADATFFTAVNARNAAAAAESYSDDAVYMEAGSAAITGRDAIRKHLENLVKLPQLAMSGEVVDIKFSDDGTVAYERGKYSLAYVDAKGNPVKDEGKYLLVWRKFDGVWKTVAESVNSDKAPAQ